LNEEIAHLHAPTNIPGVLESIDCPIKKIPQQKQGYDYILKPCCSREIYRKRKKRETRKWVQLESPTFPHNLITVKLGKVLQYV